MHALVITLSCFALILVLVRLKLPLPAAILSGAVACGAGLGMEPLAVLTSMGEAIIQPRTIGLVIIVAMLLGLSGLMRTGGQMERIVELAKQILRTPSVTMAALPALIGLLPMPGGALFSAPMVASAAGGRKVSPERLSAINYWFRHVWEYWWPLFPGLMVAVAITSQSVGTFFVFHFPLSVLTIAAGLLMFRGTHHDLHIISARPGKGTKRKFVKETSSIWLVLVVWLAVRTVLLILPVRPGPVGGGQSGYTRLLISAAGTYLPVLVGVAVSLVWTGLMNRPDRKTLLKSLVEANIPEMIVLVLAVMVFQHVLKSADAPARIGRELTAMHVPIIAVFAILPFVAGMVTGLAIGFVGTSFPILMGLLALAGNVSHPPYIAIAYLFGHMGQMVSPLHLCQVVSNKYFKTGYAGGYVHLLPVVAVTLLLGMAYITLLMLIMN